MMLPYPKNGRWGFVDERGRWRIEPMYSYAETFSGGLAIVRDEGGRAGAIDEMGRVVIPFIYRELESFWGGFAVGHRIDFSECEILHRMGMSVMIADSLWLSHLEEGLFTVAKRSIDGFSIVNQMGDVLSSVIYQDVIGVSSQFGFVHCKRNDAYRIEDFKGRTLKAYDVDDMFQFCNGRTTARKGEMWGIVDILGRVILPMGFRQIQRIDDTMDRYVLVELPSEGNGLFHLYDMRSGTISAWVADAVSLVQTGHGCLYWVLQNDMWSLKNDKFETIMPNVGFFVNTIDGENLVGVKSEDGFRYLVLDHDGYKPLF